MRRAVCIVVSVLSTIGTVVEAESQSGSVAVVDGVTGALCDAQIAGAVVQPGEQVLVRILNADLIQYSYMVRVDSKLLRLEYHIVGVEQGQGDSPLLEMALRTAQAPVPGEKSPPGKQAIEDLTQMAIALRDAHWKAQNSRDDAWGVIAGPITKIAAITGGQHRIAWPPVGCDPATLSQATSTWPSTYTRWFSGGADDLAATATEFGRKHGIARADLSVADQDNVKFKVELKLMRAKKEIDKELHDEMLKFAGELQAMAVAMDQSLQLASTALSQAQLTVGRWERIIASHPEPVLEQMIPIDRRSMRHTVTVERTPLTAASRAAEPKPQGEKDKAEASVIASFSFESHALYRFNLALGFASLWLDDDRSFGVQAAPDGSGGIEYRVRETDATQVTIEPVVLLGIYFKGVDNYARKRPPGWMFQIGVELDSSPDQYLAGIGLDLASGFVVGVGVTYYDGTKLASGFSEGDLVPSPSGTPALTSVPTRKEDALGAYVTLAFRPAIFKAFWGQRKN